MIYALVTCAPCQAPSSSCSLNRGMWFTAGTCSPRISGVAAMAGFDVNQPRAKANTTVIKCLSCATEHRRLAGGGIGVTTGGRRANQKGANPGQIVPQVTLAAYKIALSALGALGTCPVNVGTPLFAWGGLYAACIEPIVRIF